MCREQGRAQSATGVARCGLNPDVVEWSLTQQPALRDTVESNATGKYEPSVAGAAMDIASHAQHHFFCHRLDAGRQIHVTLFEL